ncbi:DUF2975 domain-containing protein [Nocardioides luteus]|uniref:DUF2975 domain-containing protein n=1 Tax=Nocardioides luteus TaxID=1844 RepID=A0A1J4MXS5_9ACTN|nr:DUF2975 domain-containing protein [Nocardioides luteus]OIJ24140.1 hypothetical protein UG56_024275 [Nocardioides luteus]
MARPSHDERPTSERDALTPLSTLVDVIFMFLVVSVLFLATLVTLNLFGIGDGASFFEFSEDVCVESDSFMVGDDEPPAGTYTKPGSRIMTSGSTFCTHRPSWATQLAASAGGILGATLLFGACLLARRIIKVARRDGIFARKPAASMRTLGWFLLAMSIIVPVGNDIGSSIFIASAAAPELDLTWSTGVGIEPDWSPLILGICALTFSRVMRRGASLQEEVALTI